MRNFWTFSWEGTQTHICWEFLRFKCFICVWLIFKSSLKQMKNSKLRFGVNPESFNYNNTESKTCYFGKAWLLIVVRKAVSGLIFRKHSLMIKFMEMLSDGNRFGLELWKSFSELISVKSFSENLSLSLSLIFMYEFVFLEYNLIFL